MNNDTNVLNEFLGNVTIASIYNNLIESESVINRAEKEFVYSVTEALNIERSDRQPLLQQAYRDYRLNLSANERRVRK